MTFSFRSCFSRTADDRKSSSRFDKALASIARLDASNAARESFRSLFSHTLLTHHTRATRNARCKHPLEVVDDRRQLSSIPLSSLIVYRETQALQIPCKGVNVFAQLRSELLLRGERPFAGAEPRDLKVLEIRLSSLQRSDGCLRL